MSDPLPPRPLTGVRVIEVSSFVAAPTAGLTLTQLGADVIRIDPVGGAPDVNRWPLSDAGRSIYWAGLNRGKRSATLDLSSDDGRSRLADLVCRRGEDEDGILISNLAGKQWLSDPQLRVRRPDLVHVQVLGRADGGSAIDYTVNAWSGLAWATGPEAGPAPVNHALPAWDLLCGMHAAVAVIAAIARRRQHGVGSHVTVSLDDVAAATLTTLGFLPEALQTDRSRPALGNSLYGTFGADFTVHDGGRVMVAAITDRQWRALLEATGTTAAISTLAERVGADFDDEGDRFRHRAQVIAVLRPWFETRTLADVAAALTPTPVLWSPFRRLVDLADELATATPPRVVVARDEPGLGRMLATDGPLRWRGEDGQPPPAAPVLGHDSEHLESGAG